MNRVSERRKSDIERKLKVRELNRVSERIKSDSERILERVSKERKMWQE